MSHPKITRRALLTTGVVGGTALVLGLHTLGPRIMNTALAEPECFQPNAYLRIDSLGKVTAIIGPSEMGQGIHTAIAMVLAEELDADWNTISVEGAPVRETFGNFFFQGAQLTAASSSIVVFYETTRRAGAAARLMLIRAAAQQWVVPVSECRTAAGVVMGPGDRRLGYGELVEAAAKLPVPAEQEIALKDPKSFRLIGHSMPRIEGRPKVTGKPVFGLDFDLPGMLTAVVARCPVSGGRLKDYDGTQAAKVQGVRAIVEIPTGVAVIADGYWPARSARELLQIQWDYGANASLSSADLDKEFRALAQKPGMVAVSKGDAAAVIERDPMAFHAEYFIPYLAHAPMEPLNCAIQEKDGGCDVWTGTQYQSLDLKVVSQVLGLPEASVRIHTLLMGGAFGRRGSPNQDVTAETAQIVKAARQLKPSLKGVPIKNVWAREDDIRGGFYRPSAINGLSATLDKDGLPTAWRHRIVSQSPMRHSELPFLIIDGVDETTVAGAKDMPYGVANLLVDVHAPDKGATVQWLRSVGNTNTCFAVESFIDELAARAKQDPFEYRRRLVPKDNTRLRAVLELAAEQAGWGKPLPRGSARGIALHDFWGTKVAQVAEVSVVDGRISVTRVTCAVDCGRAINPDGIKAQIEGGIIYALSGALYGEITLRDGQVQQANFDTFPVLRMNVAPAISVHIVSSSEAPSGVGEVACPNVAPALCNAIFAATGKRIRDLPLSRSGLQI